MNDINPMTKALGHLFWPNQMTPRPAGAPTDWLRFARWAAAAFTAFTTGVQLIVWGMIAVVRQSIDSPWRLWSAVPGVLVTAFLTWMLNTRDQLGIEPNDPRPSDDRRPAPSPLA
ncbi:hypothetical protein [Aeromicrobium ginsengisoli]|uniref:Uncharacterized protein n=1 Tax=Aeromicrobium ginsengisoli TaxID=363867 RepID=A0A5M4FJS1_9ACTN|nr:hypothetical protein [Aeromicrobium ginsengisoli]KAA1400340.1 hypothetical protein ESP70_006330 [Aeromicrobium ginsengisoli]